MSATDESTVAALGAASEAATPTPGSTGGRSFRFLLTLALRRAKLAVEHDQAERVQAAIGAYREAVNMLALIRDRTDDANREVLQHFHRTYSDRIDTLMQHMQQQTQQQQQQTQHTQQHTQAQQPQQNNQHTQAYPQFQQQQPLHQQVQYVASTPAPTQPHMAAIQAHDQSMISARTGRPQPVQSMYTPSANNTAAIMQGYYGQTLGLEPNKGHPTPTYPLDQYNQYQQQYQHPHLAYDHNLRRAQTVSSALAAVQGGNVPVALPSGVRLPSNQSVGSNDMESMSPTSPVPPAVPNKSAARRMPRSVHEAYLKKPLPDIPQQQDNDETVSNSTTTAVITSAATTQLPAVGLSESQAVNGANTDQVEDSRPSLSLASSPPTLSLSLNNNSSNNANDNGSESNGDHKFTSMFGTLLGTRKKKSTSNLNSNGIKSPVSVSSAGSGNNSKSGGILSRLSIGSPAARHVADNSMMPKNENGSAAAAAAAALSRSSSSMDLRRSTILASMSPVMAATAAGGGNVSNTVSHKKSADNLLRRSLDRMMRSPDLNSSTGNLSISSNITINNNGNGNKFVFDPRESIPPLPTASFSLSNTSNSVNSSRVSLSGSRRSALGSIFTSAGNSSNVTFGLNAIKGASSQQTFFSALAVPSSASASLYSSTALGSLPTPTSATSTATLSLGTAIATTKTRSGDARSTHSASSGTRSRSSRPMSMVVDLSHATIPAASAPIVPPSHPALTLARKLMQSIESESWLSDTFHVPRTVWFQSGIRIMSYDYKMQALDMLAAAMSQVTETIAIPALVDPAASAAANTAAVSGTSVTPTTSMPSAPITVDLMQLASLAPHALRELGQLEMQAISIQRVLSKKLRYIPDPASEINAGQHHATVVVAPSPAVSNGSSSTLSMFKSMTSKLTRSGANSSQNDSKHDLPSSAAAAAALAANNNPVLAVIRRPEGKISSSGVVGTGDKIEDTLEYTERLYTLLQSISFISDWMIYFDSLASCQIPDLPTHLVQFTNPSAPEELAQNPRLHAELFSPFNLQTYCEIVARLNRLVTLLENGILAFVTRDLQTFMLKHVRNIQEWIL
ncbi:hypothetical protein GQ42DRAFT_161451, partial [Ramicandelaber brevisporus]